MDETALKQAVQLIKAGQKPQAVKLLVSFVKANPDHELGWLWLCGAVDNPEYRIKCLNRVVAINPNNEKAKRLLDQLQAQSGKIKPVSPPEQTTVLPPIVNLAPQPQTEPSPIVPHEVVEETPTQHSPTEPADPDVTFDDLRQKFAETFATTVQLTNQTIGQTREKAKQNYPVVAGKVKQLGKDVTDKTGELWKQGSQSFIGAGTYITNNADQLERPETDRTGDIYRQGDLTPTSNNSLITDQARQIGQESAYRAGEILKQGIQANVGSPLTVGKTAEAVALLTYLSAWAVSGFAILEFILFLFNANSGSGVGLGMLIIGTILAFLIIIAVIPTFGYIVAIVAAFLGIGGLIVGAISGFLLSIACLIAYVGVTAVDRSKAFPACIGTGLFAGGILAAITVEISPVSDVLYVEPFIIGFHYVGLVVLGGIGGFIFAAIAEDTEWGRDLFEANEDRHTNWDDAKGAKSALSMPWKVISKIIDLSDEAERTNRQYK